MSISKKRIIALTLALQNAVAALPVLPQYGQPEVKGVAPKKRAKVKAARKQRNRK